MAEYRAAGAPVIALTVVNEPKASPGYSPSMAMSADQQGRLVGTLLRPRLDAAGLRSVAVLGYDHNWDDTAYPTALLTGPYAGAFAGAAFHCYGGDESAQTTVAAAAPGKQVWTTECSGGTWSPDFPTNLRWNARHMLVGAFRNQSRASLWFNLALDPSGGPTNGGCTTCRGVLTIDPATGSVTRNVEYWLLAQFGRGVRPGRGAGRLHGVEPDRRAVGGVRQPGRVARAGAVQRGRLGPARHGPVGRQGRPGPGGLRVRRDPPLVRASAT